MVKPSWCLPWLAACRSLYTLNNTMRLDSLQHQINKRLFSSSIVKLEEVQIAVTKDKNLLASGQGLLPLVNEDDPAPHLLLSCVRVCTSVWLAKISPFSVKLTHKNLTLAWQTNFKPN